MSSNTDSGVVSSSQQQPGKSIKNADYLSLLLAVSKWWKANGDIVMLKVLLLQFKSIDKAKIEKENDVEQLFNFLRSSGESSKEDLLVIFELVQICGLAGVKSAIEKIEAFKGFEFEKLEIKHFSDFRQKLIKFGKNLGVASIKTIGFLHEIDVKVHKVNPWCLIWALEEEEVIKEDDEKSIKDFTETLRRNGLNVDADILENPL